MAATQVNIKERPQARIAPFNVTYDFQLGLSTLGLSTLGLSFLLILQLVNMYIVSVGTDVLICGKQIYYHTFSEIINVNINKLSLVLKLGAEVSLFFKIC